LPPPPTPTRTQPNSPVDVTLPVAGIRGLTVTVHIPVASVPIGDPLYKVSNSTDLTLSVQDGASPVTLTFNHPVRGVRALMRVRGRFGHRLIVTANTPWPVTSTNPPAEGEVDVAGWDYPGFQTSVAPLNILSAKNDVTMVSFGSPNGDAEYFYFDLINVRVQSATLDFIRDVSSVGLQQWLRADMSQVDTPEPSAVSVWPDQSGHGNDASSVSPDPAGSPSLDIDGGHCTHVVVFNGGQSLQSNLPISGWTAMTVIMAAESSFDNSRNPRFGENAAVSWQENASWGETFFTPLQSMAFFRFGTTQPNNQPQYYRPFNIGGDFSITTAIHDERVDSLYVNGKLALRQRGKHPALSGIGSVETIGAGYNGTFFTGKIGEILIYDRALPDKEREAIEYYLKVKYGVL
jgi:hypothetical protein